MKGRSTSCSKWVAALLCRAPVGAICNIVHSVETQRQWSDLAIARTTPALFALFSLVCLMAYRWVTLGQALPIRVTAWYRKSEATFSDVLAMVSRVLWAGKYFTNSMDQPQPHELTPEDWEVLLDQLASTA